MSLTSALRTASSALSLNAAQSAIVARNIAGAGDTTYSRKVGETISEAAGGARLVRIDRAADPALRKTLLGATASSGASDAIAAGLTRLAQSVGDTTDTVSPAAKLAAFGAALQSAAATPSDAALARAAVAAGKDLAGGLNQASALVQSVRLDADKDMGASVDRINALLADFDRNDRAVVTGLRSNADVTDALDARDATLGKIATEIGVTAVPAADGGMSLYTDSGATLYNGGPRRVTMQTSVSLPNGMDGAAVTVDGVAVTGAHSPMPLRTGALAGLAQLRDTIAPRYGAQLDAIAVGLVDAFAETDTSGAGGPSKAGLFTSAGGTFLPSNSAGLAASIGVAATVDPDSGGTVGRLRDGNISGAGAGYGANPTGAASFGDRLRDLVDKFDATRPFPVDTGLETSANLSSYGASSVGWLQSQRQAATSNAATNTALASTTSAALSNAVGVSLDDQMSRMLAIENAYSASAKLLSTANGMFTSLFAAVGP